MGLNPVNSVRLQSERQHLHTHSVISYPTHKMKFQMNADSQSACMVPSNFIQISLDSRQNITSRRDH